MALLHGKTAIIQWDADDTDINLLHGQSWSIDITHDAVETTSMQDVWKTYLTGMQDATITVECLLDSAGTNIPIGGDDGMGDDDTARLELYLNFQAGDYDAIYGTAICTGIAIGSDKDEVPTVAYTFQANAQWQWHTGAARPV